MEFIDTEVKKKMEFFNTKSPLSANRKQSKEWQGLHRTWMGMFYNEKNLNALNAS